MTLIQSERQQTGFTLIEIMVVMVIIAVMSVAVSLSLGGDADRNARLQANRFMAVVNEVRDEAIIAGDSFTLTVEEKSRTYRFGGTRANSSDVLEDALFKPRTLDSEVKLKWEVFEVFETDQDVDPKVLITSLGEITPFELHFGGDEKTFTVFLNQDGELERRVRNRGL